MIRSILEWSCKYLSIKENSRNCQRGKWILNKSNFQIWQWKQRKRRNFWLAAQPGATRLLRKLTLHPSIPSKNFIAPKTPLLTINIRHLLYSQFYSLNIAVKIWMFVIFFKSNIIFERFSRCQIYSFWT